MRVFKENEVQKLKDKLVTSFKSTELLLPNSSEQDTK